MNTDALDRRLSRVERRVLARRRPRAASGSSRSASAGTARRARSSSSSWRSIRSRVAALRAGQRADVDRVHARPRAARAVALGQPVHDRVAAVDEHHEQRADAVARPPLHSAWIWYSDEPSPTTASTGRSGRAIRTPIAAGSGEAEHPHRADEAERRGGGHARVQLRAAGGRLLEQDRVAREALGERGEDVAGARAAPRRPEGVAVRAASAPGRRVPARVDRLRQRRADRGRARPAPRARPGCGGPRPGPG